ncbi:MAG: Wzt carbohydrate-binding domain-containing protein, partial [Bryobacteraceae bacterium]
LSDRAILLLGGRIEAQGDPKDVINRYIGLVLERQRTDLDRERSAVQGSFRHGDGTSEIVEVRLAGRDGEPRRVVSAGEPVAVRVRTRFHRPQADPMVGLLIRTRIGMDVYGTNTRIEQIDLGRFDAGDELEVEFHFECWLAPQEYTLTVATQHADGSSHDWVDEAVSFEVVDARSIAGVADLRARVSWRKQREGAVYN